MARILGISGSLRKASFNTGLLNAAVDLMPMGSVLHGYTLQGVPLYDGDLEAAEGVPPAVAKLKEELAQADGVLLVSPEYNSGMPGVFKNGIDWMSRPPGGTGLFAGKPVALIGASPGGFGTILAQSAWLQVLRGLGMTPWLEGKLMVSRAGGLFDEAGALQDDETRKRLGEFLEGFVGFIGK